MSVYQGKLSSTCSIIQPAGSQLYSTRRACPPAVGTGPESSSTDIPCKEPTDGPSCPRCRISICHEPYKSPHEVYIHLESKNLGIRRSSGKFMQTPPQQLQSVWGDEAPKRRQTVHAAASGTKAQGHSRGQRAGSKGGTPLYFMSIWQMLR